MSARLAIKVVPGASRSVVAGWLGDALKIRVSSPPEKGRANRDVVKLLASALDLSSSQVSIISGHSNPRKTIELSGVDQADIERAFGNPGTW